MVSDFDRISGKTKLIGLLGTPIAHSLSPRMHNLSFKELGLDYNYLAFDVDNEQLPDVIKGMRALHVRGFNVTMPNKTKILPLLDELSEEARLTGAVNTVVNNNGKLKGYTTDGIGYMCSLREENVDIIGKKMTLIGAGGAATAIAVQAAMDGVAEIAIFNSKDCFLQRAQKNVDIINNKMKDKKCKAKFYDLDDVESLQREIATSAVFTDASPMGMHPLEDKSVITDASMLRSDLVVFDVVYIPRKTKLLKLAESQGCKTINGLGMMLWQGAKSFEIWTGQKMPIDLVKKDLF